MKPILVTGGARGLGAEVCHQLAKGGHDLVIHYRKSEKQAIKLAQTCRKYGVQVETISGDFSSPESLELFTSTYLNRFSNTKGLVNNVGNYLIAPLFETSKKQWYSLFQTNFFASIFLIQALAPSLRQQKGGIINIGVSGLSRPFTKATAFAATKSTLWFYTLSLAKQLAPDFVRVNMVSPGYLENTRDPPPLKRLVSLEEVARVVAFLFEKESQSITGQNIEIAGEAL